MNFCNAFQNTNKTSEQVSAVRTVLTVVFSTSAYRTMFKNDEKKKKRKEKAIMKIQFSDHWRKTGKTQSALTVILYAISRQLSAEL